MVFITDILIGLFFLGGLYFIYMAYAFSKISPRDYSDYKNELSEDSGLKGLSQVISGDSSITREAASHGDGRDESSGKIITKSSHSTNHTKLLFR